MRRGAPEACAHPGTDHAVAARVARLLTAKRRREREFMVEIRGGCGGWPE